MTCHERDQRQYHALREHIDSLLARGASLVGRDPVRLSLEGRIFTVQHGMLVGSEDPQDLLEAFADNRKSQACHRDLVLDICLRQLSEVIETASPLDQATAQTAVRCVSADARPAGGRTPRGS